MAPSAESVSKASLPMESSTVFPASPAKNVTIGVNYELPMVDQFMKVERKRRSSTNPTGATQQTSNHENDVPNVATASASTSDDSNNHPHAARSPPGRRVSSRDKQKRNVPVERARVRYDMQMVPPVKRNQAFLNSFESWWIPARPPPEETAKRRSTRLQSTTNLATVSEDGQCHCFGSGDPEFPFLEDSSVLWIPSNRSEWEDTVSEMTSVCTQAALRRRRTTDDKKKPFVPPLSRDYIRDRIDIDDPLCGYQLRHKQGGWLQGFVLYTNFTTWTHGFHWDSKHAMSGFPTDSAAYPNMDMDGSLAMELEAEPRSGDPRGGGIVFPSLAEIGLLGGLGCGEIMLRMALTDILKNPQYKYVVLQATDQSKAFYERFGFVRVGAICQYGKSEKDMAKLNGKSTQPTSANGAERPQPSAVNGNSNQPSASNGAERPQSSTEQEQEQAQSSASNGAEPVVEQAQKRSDGAERSQPLTDQEQEQSGDTERRQPAVEQAQEQPDGTERTQPAVEEAQEQSDGAERIQPGVEQAQEQSVADPTQQPEGDDLKEQPTDDNAEENQQQPADGSTEQPADNVTQPPANDVSEKHPADGDVTQHPGGGDEAEQHPEVPSGAAAVTATALASLDLSNMPVVGYRHWTHANESERSLQKHGGPSYMMCLKLPERTPESKSAATEPTACLQCGGSFSRTSDVSFTDHLLAMLLVENKPRVEQLGATSTPGGPKFLRRSMSMPIEISSSRCLDTTSSGSSSPRVGKKQSRRASDMKSSVVSNASGSKGKNNVTALSTAGSLIQNKAVRVAKMPKRSHSMAEVEGPPRKRQKVELSKSASKKSGARGRPGRPKKSSKAASEVRPPSPKDGKPLSYAQKQYHSVWLAVPPDLNSAAAGLSPPRAHPRERAALAAAKPPLRTRKPPPSITYTTSKKASSSSTTKRKVGRPPTKKVGRPAKKKQSAKSYRSSTSRSNRTTAKAESGRIFHSIRGPDGKFIRVETKSSRSAPKRKKQKAEPAPKKKAAKTDVRKKSSSKKKKKSPPKFASPASPAPPAERSLFDLMKSRKTRSIDPKTFRKQKVQAFPKEKNHFFNRIVRRKRGSADKYFYVLEYDDTKKQLCLVPLITKGTLSGQREGRPRYRCDIGDTDSNFKIVSASDYVVVRSCAIMKTSLVASEAWDIETSEDENFVTRTS